MANETINNKQRTEQAVKASQPGVAGNIAII